MSSPGGIEFKWTNELIQRAIEIAKTCTSNQEATKKIKEATGYPSTLKGINRAMNRRNLPSIGVYLQKIRVDGSAYKMTRKPIPVSPEKVKQVAGKTSRKGGPTVQPGMDKEEATLFASIDEDEVHERFTKKAMEEAAREEREENSKGPFPQSKEPAPLYCREHQMYTAMRPPVATAKYPNGCVKCLEIWKTKHGEDPGPDLVEDLARLVGRKSMGFEDVCDELELFPGKVRELVDQARMRGYRIEFIGGSEIGARPIQSSLEEQEVHIQAGGEERIIALVGDIHFGNKHHMGKQFQDFCDIAYDAGVRNFLHVGDLLDGVYRHSRWEQDRQGYEQQKDYAVEMLPKYPGAKWDWIQGNHDETLGEMNGMDVGIAVDQAFRAAGRNDLQYHGARGAYIRLKAPGDERGVLVHLWHPRDKAAAYAKSYRLQKKVEGYQPGQKPDILAAGHWHQAMYLPVRGVHCFSTGCWQGSQSSFGKSLTGAPDIGSWIIRYTVTPNGTIRSMDSSWISYQEVETVRDVGLG